MPCRGAAYPPRGRVQDSSVPAVPRANESASDGTNVRARFCVADAMTDTGFPELKGDVMRTSGQARNVVLVHGGFVDGSGWQAVYDILTKDGYNVSVVQNPTLSLEGDVAATRQVIDEQPGPVVLVGHSYGGAVITEAGTHDKVAA